MYFLICGTTRKKTLHDPQSLSNFLRPVTNFYEFFYSDSPVNFIRNFFKKPETFEGRYSKLSSKIIIF